MVAKNMRTRKVYLKLSLDNCSRCMQIDWIDQINRFSPDMRNMLWVTIWYTYHDMDEGWAHQFGFQILIYSLEIRIN